MLTPVADGIMAHEVTPFEYTDNTRAYVMAIFVDTSDDCARGYVQYAHPDGSMFGVWVALLSGNAREFLSIAYRIERFITTNPRQSFDLCVSASLRHCGSYLVSLYDVSPDYVWSER